MAPSRRLPQVRVSPLSAADQRLPANRLRRLRFLRELTAAEAGHLGAIGRLRSYADGDCLAIQGTPKRHRVLYVVVEGALAYVKRVEIGRDREMLRLGPGDVGGFLTFFNDGPSPVSVLSRGRTTVFELGRQELEGLTLRQPQLAVKLLTALAREATARLEGALASMATASAWGLELTRRLEAFPLAADREP